MDEELTVTPYATAEPYAMGFPAWTPEEDVDRIQSYIAYDAMYWNIEDVFELIRRTEDGAPILLPKPRVVVDTTSHYLMKGLTITVENKNDHADLVAFLDDFLNRERFYSRWAVAKHHGVCLGDWIFHITADPTKPEGSRISLTTVDPGAYFPEFDPDDLDRRTGVKLVEQWPDPEDESKTVLKILRYWRNLEAEEGSEAARLVWREESLWEMEGWNNPEKARLIKVTIPQGPLPPDITQIPVYHFRNREWGKNPFGTSELAGLERIFMGQDQAISDEEIALALVGLGVYATDAGRPLDDNGQEKDWEVAPGMVWEMPGATMVKKLEGITSVTPVLDHVRYLDEALWEASGTSDVALGRIDAQTAESGIALAIKFIPTLAKIEERDTMGLELITQMFFDLKFWIKVFESHDWTSVKLIPKLGQKLPINRQKVIEELNNMIDRKVISKQFYRDEIERQLGYTFPVSIAQDILNEQQQELELKAQFQPSPDGQASKGVPGPGGRLEGAGDTLPKENNANNKARVNESNGSE